MDKWMSELTVLDLSTVLAGPSVATFFAELGARVIKVENPRGGGDATRSWKIPSEEESSSVSAYFSSVNYGKTYLQADLTTPGGRESVLDLVAGCDIIITNFREGKAEQLGVDYATVSALQPKIIYAHLGGFEHPSDRLAYDVVLQAETGYMSMNGSSTSGPIKMPIAVIDILAAHQLKEGILTALWKQGRTGKSYYVSCSLEAAALSALTNQASTYLMTGSVPGRTGSLHPNIAPYGEILLTRDKKEIILAIGSDEQFHRFCLLVSRPNLSADQRFLHNQDRVRNRAALYDEIKDALTSSDAAYWMPLFLNEKVPVGRIKNLPEVLDDPTISSFILEEMQDDMTTRRMRSAVFTISE